MNATEKRTIKKFYDRLYRLTESSRDFEKLTDICRKEEREHRRFGTAFTEGRARWNMPLGKTAEYFAVREVLDGLTDKYTAADFLHVRQSRLMGAGIADKFRAKIEAEFPEAERAEFAALDYCELIK